MKLSLILLLLLLFISGSVFAQVEDQEITFDEIPQRESEPATTHQDYSIINGRLIVNYTLVDPGDLNIGCSGGITSYSILLPYTDNGSEVALTKNDFTFRYSYSGGMLSIESQEAELINLSFDEIDGVVYVRGHIQYISLDDNSKRVSRNLNVNLEFESYTSINKKHYNYRMSNSVLELPIDPTPNQIEEPVIFSEIEPEFPGGAEGLMKYINENIKYPQSCTEAGIQGRVYLSFIIEKDGSISTVKLLRGIHKDMDREAIRVIKNMPKWKPGEMANGRKVRVRYNVPVSFRLM